MSTTPGCLCGSGLDYSACCQPLHRGAQPAQTAGQLMRSRYSAYCVADAAYLQATHHPSTRASQEYDLPEQSLNWVYLEILSSSRGSTQDQQGEVEFIAWYLDPDNQLHPLHERSRFVREQGQWLYLDGITPPSIQRRQPDLGRNSPCWCGSGHKFKRCHGGKGA